MSVLVLLIRILIELSYRLNRLNSHGIHSQYPYCFHEFSASKCLTAGDMWQRSRWNFFLRSTVAFNVGSPLLMYVVLRVFGSVDTKQRSTMRFIRRERSSLAQFRRHDFCEISAGMNFFENELFLNVKSCFFLIYFPGFFYLELKISC